MFGKIAPETAKKTVAITKLLQESCHTCGHAKGERCFGRVVKAPVKGLFIKNGKKMVIR